MTLRLRVYSTKGVVKNLLNFVGDDYDETKS